MGERARAIGSEAETKVLNFLRNLGYRILEANNEEFDIDCLAEFSPLIGKYTLAKPRNSPKGLTAFEVTEEPFRKAKINNFQAKIARYNEKNSSNGISAGIIIVDQRLSPGMIDYMKKHDVFGWGSSSLQLYKEKLKTFNSWKDTYGPTAEIILDEETSYLLCSCPPPTKSDNLLYLAIFFDNMLCKLSTRKLTEIMKTMRTKSLSPILDVGIVPINVHFECHSIGGLGNVEEDFEKHIVNEWMKEGINIRCAMAQFRDYRTFANI